MALEEKKSCCNILSVHMQQKFLCIQQTTICCPKKFKMCDNSHNHIKQMYATYVKNPYNKQTHLQHEKSPLRHILIIGWSLSWVQTEHRKPMEHIKTPYATLKKIQISLNLTIDKGGNFSPTRAHKYESFAGVRSGVQDSSPCSTSFQSSKTQSSSCFKLQHYVFHGNTMHKLPTGWGLRKDKIHTKESP
jgi:hypothetical protein